MAFKTEAIVLYERQLKGADRIYEILTPNEGLLSIVARGVSRSSSKLSGFMQQFDQVMLMIGRGRQDHLAGARTLQSYRTLRHDWYNFLLTSSLVELLLTVNVPGQMAHKEFEMVRTTFDLLVAHRGDRTRQAVLGRIFLWKMLALSGWQPNLEQCAVCKRQLNNAICYVSPKGFCCTHHGLRGMNIDGRIRDLIIASIESDTMDPGFEHTTSPDENAEWLRITQLYYQDIIHTPIQSLTLFNHV